MKKFTFIILEKDKSDLPKGVMVECMAPEWDELCTEENFIGDYIDTLNVKSFLQTAYCMFGHTFNPGKHTPRKLYEALISNNSYQIFLEGDIPKNLLEYENLPPGACD